jgi:hypothetical protein
MGRALTALLIAFAVTLAVVVGNRMSTEAMAVVVGVVCGVAAGIPMSLLILLATRRRHREAEGYGMYGQQTRRDGSYPPVVVIQGGTPVPNQPQLPYYGSSVEAAPRQFHIVGGE